jgi:hypothetical protein
MKGGMIGPFIFTIYKTRVTRRPVFDAGVVMSYNRLYSKTAHCDCDSIVTYRPSARQRLDKHVPAETDSW